AAHGDVLLVLIGLLLSMALLVAGGALVATILNHFPWLNYVGGLILLILVGEMIAGDPVVAGVVGHPFWLPWTLTLASALGIGVLLYRRQRLRIPTHMVEVVPAS